MQPIAILLAACNGQKYIRQMLVSLQNQTCADFICYIHDDGSKDETPEILREFCQRDPGHFCQLEGPVQGGAKENFLWMLGQVEAQVYMFADQDDVWLPDKIEKSLAALFEADAGKGESAGEKLCVFTDMYVTDEQLRVTDASFIRHIGRDPFATRFSQVVIDNPAAGCSMMFTRRLRDMALQLKDPGRVEMHDVWLLSVAAACGQERVGVLDEPLVYYRQHADNEKGASADGFCGKIKRNLLELFSGKMAGSKRAFIRSARDLAGQVCQVNGIDPGAKETLREFSRIGEKSKLGRIAFYRRHGFTRGSRAQTLWMYFWV